MSSKTWILKMKKLFSLLILFGTLISCNQKNQDQSMMEEAMAMYNQNAKVVPDGGVRIYAKWSADLGDISMEGIKAYEVFKFDTNNKIIEVDEYMDVSGMLNKIAELSSE
jgi:hypothetical protein